MNEVNKIRAHHGLPLYAEATRTCLRCQKGFTSWGIGNRICPTCTEVNEEKIGEEYCFDPDSNFQYDLTVAELIQEAQHKGLELEWNKNYKK